MSGLKNFRLRIWPKYILEWTGHEIGLTYSEGVIFSRLCRGANVTYYQLAESLYEDREDGGPDYSDETIRVLICRLRKKLHGSPFTIPKFRCGYVSLLNSIADEVLTDT